MSLEGIALTNTPEAQNQDCRLLIDNYTRLNQMEDVEPFFQRILLSSKDISDCYIDSRPDVRHQAYQKLIDSLQRRIIQGTYYTDALRGKSERQKQLLNQVPLFVESRWADLDLDIGLTSAMSISLGFVITVYQLLPRYSPLYAIGGGITISIGLAGLAFLINSYYPSPIRGTTPSVFHYIDG